MTLPTPAAGTTHLEKLPCRFNHHQERGSGPPGVSQACSPSEDVWGVPVHSCSKVASQKPSRCEFAVWDLKVEMG